jgi:hypothetical protein
MMTIGGYIRRQRRRHGFAALLVGWYLFFGLLAVVAVKPENFTFRVWMFVVLFVGFTATIISGDLIRCPCCDVEMPARLGRKKGLPPLEKCCPKCGVDFGQVMPAKSIALRFRQRRRVMRVLDAAVTWLMAPSLAAAVLINVYRGSASWSGFWWLLVPTMLYFGIIACLVRSLKCPRCGKDVHRLVVAQKDQEPSNKCPDCCEDFSQPMPGRN